MEAFAIVVVVSLLGCASALPTPCLPVAPPTCGTTPNTPYSFFQSVYSAESSFSYFSSEMCVAVGYPSIPNYIPQCMYDDIERMMLEEKCKWLSSFTKLYPPNITPALCDMSPDMLLYDIVMVYSGPATLSALESYIEQGFRVAIVEEGLFPPLVANSMYYRHSMLNSPFVKRYKMSIPGCGIEKCIPVPNCLGGISVFDSNTWNYGRKDFYDRMAKLNDVFRWENAKLRYEKFESYERETTKTQETQVQVGPCGSVRITTKTRETSVTRRISTLFEEMGYGNGFTPLDIECAPGLSIIPRIGEGNQSLLYPQEIFSRLTCFDNVDLILGVQIKRLVFEYGRVVGVEVITPGGTIIIRARYDVILGCSPIPMFDLLTRSGLGNPLYMNKFGIEVVGELPYLGQNLIINPICICPFIAFPCGTLIDINESDNDYSSMDFLFGGSSLSYASSLSYYSAFLNVGGSMSVNVMMKFYAFTKSMSYRIQFTLSNYFQLDFETVQWVIEMCNKFDLLFVVPQLLSPKSRGYIEYGETLEDIRINSGMYSDEEDILAMTEAIQFIQQMGSTSAFTSVGGQLMNLPFKSIPNMSGDIFSPDCIRQWLPYSSIPNLHIGGGGIIGTDITTSCVDSDFYFHGFPNLQCLSTAVSPYTFYSDSIAISSLIGRYGSEFMINRYNNGFYESFTTSSSSSSTFVSNNGIGNVAGIGTGGGIISGMDTYGSGIDMLSGSSGLSSFKDYEMEARELEALSGSNSMQGVGGSSMIAGSSMIGGSSLTDVDIDMASCSSQSTSLTSNGASSSYSTSEAESGSYSSDTMMSGYGVSGMQSIDTSYATSEFESGSTTMLGNGGIISECQAAEAEASSSSYQAVTAGIGGIQSVSQSATETSASSYESSSGTILGSC